MSCPKIFNQIESDTHQILSDIKIREICERYYLGNERYFLNEGKSIIDRILLRLKSSDLAENNEIALSVINQETDGCPEKTAIEKILHDISQLLAFKQEFLGSPQRRLECLRV